MEAWWVVVNDWMQQGYRYALSAPVGRDLHRDFRPDFRVFGGKYMTDCCYEFPTAGL